MRGDTDVTHTRGLDAPPVEASVPPGGAADAAPGQPAATRGAPAPRSGSDDPGDGRAATLSRRGFLGALLGAAGLACVAGSAAPVLRYAFPVTDAAAAPKLEVAKLSELTPLGEAVLFEYMDMPCALVLMEDGRPKAFSLVCTHLGCIVMWRREQQDFYCPCHAAVFAADGSVVKGPPPAPLMELNVLVEADVLSVKGMLA